MIKAHEQQMELRLPRIGVIRKGGEMTRGATPQQNRPGKDLDHFRLDRADAAVATAWTEALGKEPKAISGILPYTSPAECLSIWDELWQGKRLLWRGDGERLHVKLEGSAYVRYAPGSGPAQPAVAGEKVGQGKVARMSRLRLLLPQLRIAGIFEVMSSSAIDADELWMNLMWIQSTVATLQGAPVTVFRAPRQFNIPDAKKPGETMLVTKYMLHMMLDGRYLDALLPSPVAGLLAPVQPAPALTAGEVTEDDAPEDGIFDDAPEDTPAAATPGPLADDEQVVYEAPAREFIPAAAALLDTDEATVKSRLHDLGYERIPGKPDERVAAYRKMKAAAANGKPAPAQASGNGQQGDPGDEWIDGIDEREQAQAEPA